MAVQVHCCISFMRGKSNPTMSSLSELEKVESTCFSKIFVSNTMESNRKHLALVIYINTLPKNDLLNQTGDWDKCVFDRLYTSWSPV